MTRQRPTAGLVGRYLPELCARTADSNARVWLAAPFISIQVAEAIVQSLPSRAVELRLVTALSGRAVASGSLNPRALTYLASSGFEIRSIPNLHAKAMLIDDDWAVLGSGNLTLGGADGGNLELGVELNSQQRKALWSEFERWWGHAEKISKTHLRDFSQVWATAVHSAPRGVPSSLGSPLDPINSSTTKSPDAGDWASRRSDSFWIKSMYDDPRIGQGEWWRNLTWVSAVHSFRGSEPIDRPSYKTGDMLLIYVKEKRVIPAIVKVCSEPRFDPSFVNRETGSQDGERWGWVSEVEVVRATSLVDGVQLGDLGASATGLQNGHIRVSERQFATAAELLGLGVA